uniref:Uncharacterized protein n=1 Tax=Arundo donax TaxID=35708 RepID=A0A0A9BNF4_ARUDO
MLFYMFLFLDIVISFINKILDVLVCLLNFGQVI